MEPLFMEFFVVSFSYFLPFRLRYLVYRLSFRKTTGLCYFLNISDQVSHSYKTKDIMMVLCVCADMCLLYENSEDK